MPRASPGAQRADQAMVARGLARSRAIAREYLDAGRVLLNDSLLRKPSTPVMTADRLELVGEPERYVGRAAYKLLRALEAFPAIAVSGRRCLDVGASTGGFTQVLLERDAKSVVALDVGHGQLAEVVRADQRVTDLPGTSIRDVTVDGLGGRFDLVVADLSFISLTLVLPVLAGLICGAEVSPPGDIVVLVKPQFEVGRERLGSDGVVRSPQQRAEAVAGVAALAEAQGLHVHGLVASDIAGARGNQEYLLWLRTQPEGRMEPAQVEAELAAIRTKEGLGPR